MGDALSIISTVISVLALAATAILAKRQESVARGANSISVLLDIFRNYTSEEMYLARTRLQRDLPGAAKEPGESGFAAIPEDLRRDVIRISHFFDGVGILVAHRLIPEDAVIAYFGNNVLNCWNKTFPFMQEERIKRRAPLYQAYFEMLARLVELKTPESIIDTTRQRLFEQYERD